MEKRKQVYESDRALNPLRFKKGIRNWDVIEKVVLKLTDEIKDKIKNKVI